MSDISSYSIPFRVQADAWLYESDRSNSAMRTVKTKLRERYDCEPPEGKIITRWMEKLFDTGSVLDKPQSGRPNERGDHVHDVKQSVNDAPQMSTRRSSEEIGILRTSLQRVLKDDLLMRAWKPCQVQFLTEDDRETRIECCRSILQNYENHQKQEN